MKTVKRLVTEDNSPKPKPVYNDYLSTTVVSINSLQKTAADAEIGDTLDGKGKIVNIATFEYGDNENPEVIAA